MDATPTDITIINDIKIVGVGDGFSAFVGLSDKNSLWVATLNNENKLTDMERVEFGKGDVLILKYGVIHAGDKNNYNVPLYKIFTEVYTGTQPVNNSKLWVKNGEGLTKTKTDFQLGFSFC